MITNQNLYYYTASTIGSAQKLPLVLAYSDHRIYCGKRNIIFNFVQHLLYLKILSLSIPILDFELTVYIMQSYAAK